VKVSGFFSLLFLLPLSNLRASVLEKPSGLGGEVLIEKVQFGRVTWGRNTVRLHYRNGGPGAVTLTFRIRSRFTDSGSGVIWEKAYPSLLLAGQEGDIRFDYFVRPDHGSLRVELEVEDSARRIIHEESREFPFEAPYRGEYLLQPYRYDPEGTEWESRVLPPFKIRESRHFFVYFFPGSEAELGIERIVASRERTLRLLSRELEVELPWKAILFLYPDAESARKLTGHRGDGWAYGRTIVEVYSPRRKIDPNHELVHLLANQIGSPPALLAEGLATSHERNFDNAGRYRARVENWCRGLLREGALIPLSELMKIASLGEDLTRPRIAYPESACFVRYLLATQGWERFRRAYAELENSSEPSAQKVNASRFESIFGLSLREAESAWKEDLSRTRGPGVPTEVVRSVVREATVPYLIARGRQLLTSGSAEEAERTLRVAVEIQPADLEAHFWLGQACHLQKEYETALREYGRVVSLGDRSTLMQVAWSRVWSGQILDVMGRREEALSQYRMAESLHDTTEVELEGHRTSALEAARLGLAHSFSVPEE